MPTHAGSGRFFQKAEKTGGVLEAPWAIFPKSGKCDSNADALGAWMAYRQSWWGLSDEVEGLYQTPDFLAEGDIGPTFYLPSQHFIAGFQPSLMFSGGDGVMNYGAGLRALTTVVMGQWLAFFHPILGYINQEWYYHLRVGVGYRFTPGTYITLNLEHRDVVDLNDLEISDNALESISVTLGLRFN